MIYSQSLANASNHGAWDHANGRRDKNRINSERSLDGFRGIAGENRSLDQGVVISGRVPVEDYGFSKQPAYTGGKFFEGRKESGIMIVK